MALENSGELNTSQKREFRCYLEGFDKGKHSLSYEEFRAEALRYAEEERLDFNDRAFQQVMRFINVTVNEIWGDRS